MWCAQYLNWEYVKCSTRKSLKAAYTSNQKFSEMVTGWTRYSIKVDAQGNVQVKKHLSIFELPKSDEFVDTLALLLKKNIVSEDGTKTRRARRRYRFRKRAGGVIKKSAKSVTKPATKICRSKTKSDAIQTTQQ